MSKLYVGGINLSKIDKEKIKISEKTGEKWLNIEFWINDQPDNYGNDGSVKQRKLKGESPIYLGNIKKFDLPSEKEANVKEEEDDLPF